MRKLRAQLTYANVMSSIAVFMVLGGSAYAAATLPKNSVGLQADQEQRGDVVEGQERLAAVQGLQGRPAAGRGDRRDGTGRVRGAKGDTGARGRPGRRVPRATRATPARSTPRTSTTRARRTGATCAARSRSSRRRRYRAAIDRDVPAGIRPRARHSTRRTTASAQSATRIAATVYEHGRQRRSATGPAVGLSRHRSSRRVSSAPRRERASASRAARPGASGALGNAACGSSRRRRTRSPMAPTGRPATKRGLVVYTSYDGGRDHRDAGTSPSRPG